jgi:hypothetical protein
MHGAYITISRIWYSVNRWQCKLWKKNWLFAVFNIRLINKFIYEYICPYFSFPLLSLHFLPFPILSLPPHNLCIICVTETVWVQYCTKYERLKLSHWIKNWAQAFPYSPMSIRFKMSRIQLFVHKHQVHKSVREIYISCLCMKGIYPYFVNFSSMTGKWFSPTRTHKT